MIDLPACLLRAFRPTFALAILRLRQFRLWNNPKATEPLAGDCTSFN